MQTYATDKHLLQFFCTTDNLPYKQCTNLNIIATIIMNVNATIYRHGCQHDVLNRPGQLTIEVWSPNMQLQTKELQDCEVWDLKNKTSSGFTGLHLFLFSSTL